MAIPKDYTKLYGENLGVVGRAIKFKASHFEAGTDEEEYPEDLEEVKTYYFAISQAVSVTQTSITVPDWIIKREGIIK